MMKLSKTKSEAQVTQEALAAMGPSNTVYIKEVSLDELKTEGALPISARIPKGIKLWAVHQMDGTRVAVLDDREAAFAAARQYEMEPVSVH